MKACSISPEQRVMRKEEDAYPAFRDLAVHPQVCGYLGHKEGKMESQAHQRPARDAVVVARPHLLRRWSSPRIVLLLTLMAVALAGCDLGTSRQQSGPTAPRAPAPAGGVPARAPGLWPTGMHGIHTLQPSVGPVNIQAP